MEYQRRFLETVAEVQRVNVPLAAFERQLHVIGEALLDDLESSLDSGAFTSDAVKQARLDLEPLVESILPLAGRSALNPALGRALSLMLRMDAAIDAGQTIMRRLLPRAVAEKSERESPRVLVINPGAPSTKVAWFEGIHRVASGETYVEAADDDTVEARLAGVLSWLERQGLDPRTLDGIACRGGFPAPVPTGIYRVVPAMLADLQHPDFDHASNMGVFIGRKLAERIGRSENLLIITRDPAGSDEVDLLDRLTGYPKILRDGVGCHYLNHRAVWRLLAHCLERKPEELSLVSAHLGGGVSVVLHHGGRAVSVMDALSDMPGANRSGMLNLARLIPAIQDNSLSLKELQRAMTTQGGLLALTGSNTISALVTFMRHGASADQIRKIELVLDYFARTISGSMMKLTALGHRVDFMAVSGGLAHTEELTGRILQSLSPHFPVLRIPGTFENESLAAGLLTALYEPEHLSDYTAERDRYRQARAAERRLIDTTVFARKVTYKKPGAPITSLDEIIDAAWQCVERHFPPTIAIVGAANEEAILAAKRANAEGQYRLAKFLLIGDFDKINKIAYDFDLVIDNDNYTVIDAEDPIQEAINAIEQKRAHILMKGNLHTEDILRGTFRYLKANNLIQKGQVMSHVAVMDIPSRNKLLCFSDGAVNTYPDPEKRVAILENALKVAHQLNIKVPKVAVISAIESVNKSVESSIEAAAIASRFAGRDDCIVEGPLSFDVAMDPKIAEEKHYSGQIRGTADLLILPDIDAGNVLWKTLTTQSGASVAGVIMCGAMPLVLTSRGDSARSKLASLSLAVKLHFDLNATG